MVTHMKTTIKISDTLLRSAKALAIENQTTLHALVEEGLRRVLADKCSPAKRAKPAFKLVDRSVRGKAVLMSDTASWRELEDKYALARFARTQTTRRN